MAKDTAEVPNDALADESTLLKKQARRRLIGAAALALLAAIVLPMVMDHQPAPPLKDIQVRIPSPDEGAPQKTEHRTEVKAASKVQPKAETLKAEPKPEAKGEIKAEAKPEPKAENRPDNKPESKSESKVEPKVEPRVEAPKSASKTETQAADKVADKSPVQSAAADRPTGEAWEVQLGAYQNSGSVTNLVGKLKQLGIPTYTEKIDTPAGVRTRVRAGPFPSQEAAEKARARIKIVGVEGPVAKKP